MPKTADVIFRCTVCNRVCEAASIEKFGPDIAVSVEVFLARLRDMMLSDLCILCEFDKLKKLREESNPMSYNIRVDHHIDHGILKCRECHCVIAQCRCPEGHKNITYTTCPACLGAKQNA